MYCFIAEKHFFGSYHIFKKTVSNRLSFMGFNRKNTSLNSRQVLKKFPSSSLRSGSSYQNTGGQANLGPGANLGGIRTSTTNSYGVSTTAYTRASTNFTNNDGSLILLYFFSDSLFFSNFFRLALIIRPIFF